MYRDTYVISNIQPKSGNWDMPNLFSSPESAAHLASQHRRIHPQREAFAGQTCHLQGAIFVRLRSIGGRVYPLKMVDLSIAMLVYQRVTWWQKFPGSQIYMSIA